MYGPSWFYAIASIVVTPLAHSLFYGLPAQAQLSDSPTAVPQHLYASDSATVLDQVSQALPGDLSLLTQAKFLYPGMSIDLAQTLETDFETDIDADEIIQDDAIQPQVADEANEIPTIRITVIEELLDQPVFTPFRREGTVREATQPIYVIDRNQIEAQGARTVDEALRFLPGILSEGTAGGQLGTVSGQFIRGGVSSQTLILLDGRPLNQIGGFGAFDLSDFTTDAVEQIEVVPGGGSVLFGSNAIGGTINIITRQSLEADGFEVSSSVEVGSFGFNRQVAQLRGRQGAIAWNLGYSRTDSDNDFPFELTTIDFEDRRQNAEVLYNNVNLKLEAEVNDRNRLRFGALYLNRDLAVPGGVPVPPSFAFNVLTGDDRQFSEDILLDLTLESKLGQGDDSLLIARVFTDFVDLTFSDPVADSAFDSPSEDDSSQTSIGLQVQHNWQFSETQNITYGIDYRHVQGENTTLDLTTNTLTQNFEDSINQGAIFARYQHQFTPRFSANFGLRQDFNDLAENPFFTSFNVGTGIKVTNTTNFRINLARNFRVPSVGDLFFEPFNNPDLEPEQGLSFDVGFDQQFGDRGLLRFTFFRNEISDAISFNLASFRPENIGRVRTIGIETEANVQLLPNLFAFANYTLNEPEILDAPNPDDEGNTLPFVDANTFNFGLAYEDQRGLYAALFLRNVSDFLVSRDNSQSLEGRTTLDFKLRVPIREGLSVSASVDNILDQQFEEFPGFPGVGRNFRVGLKSDF